eukprot:4842452-Amphidinium_carterae.1
MKINDSIQFSKTTKEFLSGLRPSRIGQQRLVHVFQFGRTKVTGHLGSCNRQYQYTMKHTQKADWQKKDYQTMMATCEDEKNWKDD